MNKLISLMFIISLGLFNVSCKNGQNPTIPGVKGPNIEFDEQKFLLTMDFETISFDLGGTFDIPKIPNSTVGVGPSLETGGTLLTISLDVNAITNGNIELQDEETLPGGRPLPGIRDGKLPAVGMTVPKFKDMTFYLSKKVMGIFIPFKLGSFDQIISYRLYAKERFIGTISLVGVDENGENSGALLLVNLTRTNKALLKAIAKHPELLKIVK